MKVINKRGNKKQSGRSNTTFCINEVRNTSKISPIDRTEKKSLNNKRRINVCVSVYKLFTRSFINTEQHGNEICTHTLYICSFVSRCGKQNFLLPIQGRFLFTVNIYTFDFEPHNGHWAFIHLSVVHTLHPD